MEYKQDELKTQNMMVKKILIYEITKNLNEQKCQLIGFLKWEMREGHISKNTIAGNFSEFRKDISTQI